MTAVTTDTVMPRDASAFALRVSLELTAVSITTRASVRTCVPTMAFASVASVLVRTDSRDLSVLHLLGSARAIVTGRDLVIMEPVCASRVILVKTVPSFG